METKSLSAYDVVDSRTLSFQLPAISAIRTTPGDLERGRFIDNWSSLIGPLRTTQDRDTHVSKLLK